MRLRNKFLNRSRGLMLLVILIQIFLWILYLSGGIPFFEGTLHILLLLFAVCTLLFMIPVFFMNLFAKSFDEYYKGLAKEEQDGWDHEIENAYHGQNVICTSRAVISVNFIIIKAIPYERIQSMRKYGNKLFLNGKEGILDVIRGSAGYPTDKIMQEILNHNHKIVQER